MVRLSETLPMRVPCVLYPNRTWTGPAWSPAQSISSVLISIQSLMTENPYHNEPGFEQVPCLCTRLCTRLRTRLCTCFTQTGY